MIGHLQLTLLAVTAIIAAHLGDAVAVCESNSTLEYQPTGQSTYGTEFFVAVPETFGFIVSSQLIIGTPSPNSNATYRINATGGFQSGLVTFESPAVIDLNYFRLSVVGADFGNREKGLQIQATGAPIFVLVTVNAEFFGFGSFLAFPILDFQQDSYEYYAISTTSQVELKTQVILVASEDDTQVTITPTEDINLPQDAQDQSSPMVAIAAGNSHTVTLNQRQTLQLYSSALSADLTGTKMLSNKPLTVISGHQCGNVPELFGFCEQLAVQVPPTLTWGTEFLLAPFAGRMTGQYYKLVAAEDNTAFSAKCGTSPSDIYPPLAAGESQTFNTRPDTYCYVRASKPVFIVQMATGGSVPTGGDNLGDPVMAIVSPTQHYVNNVSFVSLQSVPFSSHHISITVRVKHYQPDDILFDDHPMHCVWKEISSDAECTVGYGCTMGILPGSHTIRHSNSDGRLSVLAYGFDSAPLRGYAFVAGMDFATSEPEPEVTGTLPYFRLEGIPELHELERVQDAVSDPINIPGGFPFGDQLVSRAYVNENGAVSFGSPWKFAHPNLFPTDYAATQNSFVVAPFWSDNDIRKSGSVRYVALTEERSTAGDEIFVLVNTFIRNQLERAGQEQDELLGFQGTWMLVAQWEGVHPYPHGAENHEGLSEDFLALTNTYQVVIMTDGAVTYVVYTYTCGEIEWSAIGDEAAVVGVNAQGLYFENHRASGLDTVGFAVSCTDAESSSRAKRQTGVKLKQVPVGRSLAEAIKQCNMLETFDKIEIPDTKLENELVAMAQPCPCSLNQARTDKRFVPIAGLPNCFMQALLNAVETRFQPRLEYGQECCYDDSGSLYRGQDDPNSGRLRVPQNDERFFTSCCTNTNGQRCGAFYARRPVDDGSRYAPPDLAYGSGDPHYRDLNGNRFDLHDNGEFLLLEAGRFQVQGVLKVVHITDYWQPALHISFAFGEPGKFAYQMVIPGSDDFAVYQTQGTGGQRDITDALSETDDVFVDETMELRITRLNGQSIEVLTRNGLYFNLFWWYWGTADIWYGNIDVWVPRHLLPTSRGIIGTAVMPDNNWRVPPTESMFITTAPGDVGRRSVRAMNKGSNKPNLSKRQLTPQINFTFPVGQRFSIADLGIEFTDEQRELCSNITECLFDLLVTGDEEVAMETMQEVVEVQQNEKELNNFPPNITGDSTFRVNLNHPSIYTFTVVDSAHPFTVEVLKELPAGAVLEEEGQGMYTFRWTLVSVTDIQAVAFRANNSEGAASLLSPRLEVCACVSGGNCTLDGVLNTTVAVIVMNCDCPNAYGGDFCEEDRDGCSEIQCFEGVVCLDVPAPGVGAVCGPCSVGYTGNGEKCSDLDECSLDATLCEQVCVNTVGSYECACEDGYQLVETTKCEDINECEGVNDCQQLCNNTEGSFICACQAGFTLNPDGKSCDADEPCRDNGGCSDICAVVDGDIQCSCTKGFRLDDADKASCIDEDECELFNPCDQICVNTNGSFECMCMDGYELQDDMKTCEDVDECLQAVLDQTDICPARTRCSNTPGSYQCPCVPGHYYFNGTCIREQPACNCPVCNCPLPPVCADAPASKTKPEKISTLLEFTDGVVGWEPPGVDVTSYEMKVFYHDGRGVVTGTQQSIIRAGQAWLQLWESFNLVQDVQYYFQVRAHNVAGSGPYSDLFKINTPVQCKCLSCECSRSQICEVTTRPSKITTVLAFEDDIVSWKSPPGELEHYFVRIFYRNRRNRIAGIQHDIVGAEQTWLRLSESFTMISGVPYYFQVRARNSVGLGRSSNAIRLVGTKEN